MKRNRKFINAVFSCAVLFALSSCAAIVIKAQTLPSAQDEPPVKRLSLLQQLELTPEQIEEIRDINRETREIMRTAAQRQRAARRALEAAIYADEPIAAEVEKQTREFAEAQAQATKLRAKTEFRIRQILKPEQLARFRELRQRTVQTNRRQQNNSPLRNNRRLNPNRRANPNRQNKNFLLRKPE